MVERSLRMREARGSIPRTSKLSYFFHLLGINCFARCSEIAFRVRKRIPRAHCSVRLFRAASSPPARKKENPASEARPRNPWIPSWRRRSANSRGSTSRARGATSTPAPPCSPSSRYISAIRLDLLPFFLTWGVS